MYTNVLHYNILKETKILLEFNLINIRYLTCSSLLICYSIGDPWKPHYGSHASYHKRAAVVKQRHHRYQIVLFWSNRCCTWMFVSDWIHFFIACYSYFSFFFFYRIYYFLPNKSTTATRNIIITTNDRLSPSWIGPSIWNSDYSFVSHLYLWICFLSWLWRLELTDGLHQSDMRC